MPQRPPPQSRRQFLSEGARGLGALSLANVLGHSRVVAQSPSPLAARRPAFSASAKRVVFLFMEGGPSHLETFDPKPELRRRDGQPLPQSLKDVDLAQTNTEGSRLMAPSTTFQRHGQAGIEISDLFPELSQHADRLAVIRSCYHQNFIHGPALTLMNSGTALLGHPSVGSWIVYGLGGETDRLPAFVAMTDGIWRNSNRTYGSGFLPAVYQGTYVRSDGAAIQNLTPPALTQGPDQRRLLDQIQLWNTRYRDARPGDSRLDARLNNYELAFRMQTAAPEAIRLGDEPAAIREQYGMNQEPSRRYGTMCLMARRLLERGVRYLHLSANGWDAHGDCPKNHRSQAQKVDRPIAALLGDLHQRGLLDETLIVWAGEFGRTPIMQGNRGRDHHPYGFSVWMAGGGIRGGQIIGSTDDLGFHAVEQRVHVNDLHATMLSLLGLRHEALTYPFEGRDRRLTDVGGEGDLSTLLRA